MEIEAASEEVIILVAEESFEVAAMEVTTAAIFKAEAVEAEEETIEREAAVAGTITRTLTDPMKEMERRTRTQMTIIMK